MKPIFTTYLAVIKSRQFLVHALSGCLSFAVLFLYVGGSPVVFMDVFHTDPRSYARIFGLLSLGWIGSNQLNILLLRRFTTERLLFVGLTCQVVACLALFVGVLNGWIGLPVAVALFFLCLSCLGLTFPNASAKALAPFERNAGSSSALLGFLQIGLAALVTALLGAVSARLFIFMTAGMAAASLLAWVILLRGTTRSTVPEVMDAAVGAKEIDDEISVAVSS